MKRIVLEKEKRLQIVFLTLACVSVIVIVLFGLAINFYPGGHWQDYSAEGFNLLYNPISDLGRTTAYNGESNTISFALYASALTMMAIIVLGFYSLIWKYFQKKRSTKWLSIFGSLCGIVQFVLYLGIAFSPADTRITAHLKFVFSGPAFLFTAILCYTIVFFIEKDFPRLNAYSYLAMVVVTILLLTAVIVGTIYGQPLFSMTRRGGHTIFIFIVTFVYGLQGIGAYLYEKKRALIQ